MEMRHEPPRSPKFEMHRSNPGGEMANRPEMRQSNLAVRNGEEEKRLLNLAGTLLARSRSLESRIMTIEMAAQACKCAKIVSDSIVDILEQAKALLYKMRDISDQRGRALLAVSFNEFLKQIDLLAAEGYYDSKNLTRNESIVIITSDSGDQKFTISGRDMSSRGLHLTPLRGDAITNAEIVDQLGHVEVAASELAAHAYTYDAIAFLLQSRMKFARGMIDVLEEGSSHINSSRAGRAAVSQALSELYRTTSEGHGPKPQLSSSTRPGHDLS